MKTIIDYLHDMYTESGSADSFQQWANDFLAENLPIQTFYPVTGIGIKMADGTSVVFAKNQLDHPPGMNTPAIPITSIGRGQSIEEPAYNL